MSSFSSRGPRAELRGTPDNYYITTVKKNPPLGPAPWTPVEASPEGPADRVLRHLADAAEPVTVPDLAAALGVHANTARSYLQELTRAGLVERGSIPSAGRGRPAHGYRPTIQGRSRARTGDPTFEEYQGLTGVFVQHLARTSSDPGPESQEIGRAWGAQLARNVDRLRPPAPSVVGDTPGAADEAAAEQVVDLLGDLGFTPVRGPEDLALTTCPLLELAIAHPEVVCQVHLGLVEGALEHYGASTTAAHLEPFSEPGACRLALLRVGATHDSPARSAHDR